MKISMSKGRLLAVLALLLGCALLWRGFFEPGWQRGMPQDTPPVRVATALAQDMPHFLNGLGTVEPSSDVLVTSRVDGHLQRLHFTEGQFVHKGDLLAEIDPRPFEAALGEARGALARDTAQLENARRDLARYEKLVSGGHIARQQYDNQRALVRQYEGTVQSDKAAVDSAALQLQYSRITAPADGVLGLRKVDEGNMVHASDTEGLVRITLLTPSYVVFTLPESRVPLVAQHWREARKSGGRLLVQAWDREQE
ncbi:efflux RND transporter periplasmic adaptor subunit, partial [Desulfovibrio piger]|uniref:efflux RND transporter periplasmic adaptor subunit n=1 Tax=Desulfovibrio piger TaxID=901 RepID=UPI0039F4C8DA